MNCGLQHTSDQSNTDCKTSPGTLPKSLNVNFEPRPVWMSAYGGKFRLITIFLYMVAELSALQQIVNALTGLYGLPAVIVECFVTTAYTC